MRLLRGEKTVESGKYGGSKVVQGMLMTGMSLGPRILVY